MIVNQTDAIYAAGYFDADGCVSIIQKNVCRGTLLRADITSSDKAVLDWFATTFGFGTITRKVLGPSALTKKDCYSWQTNAHLARQFLEQVVPYLKVKQKQVVLAIEMQRGKSNGGVMSDERFAYEQSIRSAVSALNKNHSVNIGGYIAP